MQTSAVEDDVVPVAVVDDSDSVVDVTIETATTAVEDDVVSVADVETNERAPLHKNTRPRKRRSRVVTGERSAAHKEKKTEKQTVG